MIIEEFISEVKKLNISLTKDQLNQLEKFYNLLIEWNKKINLTRIIEKEDVYLKHFYDSLTITKVINLDEINNLCDVGTGAGFPGIVLKIVFPNLEITLIDSLQKRVNYLNDIIEKINLKGIKAIHERAQEHEKKYSNYYDVVTARAVANLNDLSKMCVPLVKENGYFIPMKANVDEEIELSKETFKKLNVEIEKKETFNLPKENSIRNILLIKKR